MPPTRQPSYKLPLQPTVFLILLALADADAHGYRLRQTIVAKSQGTVKLDPGSLYRLIAKLFDDGLVAESAAPPDADDQDDRRKYYTLTRRGRAVLAAETDRMAHLVAASRAVADRPRHA